MAYQFGDFRFYGTTQNIKKKLFSVWRLIISHIISHCKFVLQGACTFLKKNSATCSFQIVTKNPKKKKFIVEPSFFTSWTIAGERCTRAHAQENKSIFVFIYIYLYLKTFLKTGVRGMTQWWEHPSLTNVTRV